MHIFPPPQQQLSAIVTVAAANSNVDVAEYTAPQLLRLSCGLSSTAFFAVAEKLHTHYNTF